MVKEIKFNPAYDKRDINPSKNYGIHGVELHFILKNEQGAVVFQLYTNWQLSHVVIPDSLSKPFPADLVYHSPKSMYEGQDKLTDNCHILNGPCYYDGSGLNAQDPWNILLKEGSDGVWKFLEEYHNHVFNGADYPVVNKSVGKKTIKSVNNKQPNNNKQQPLR